MKYISFLGLAFCLASLSLSAQSLERSVIGSTGGYSEVGGLKVSSTVGEIVINTGNSGTLVLTQGFQQPSEGSFTRIDQPTLSVDYKLYPNPTSDQLFLEFTSLKAVELKLALFDLQGRMVGNIQESLTVNGSLKRNWSLEGLSEGNYQLRMLEPNGQLVKTIKIQKIRQ